MRCARILPVLLGLAVLVSGAAPASAQEVVGTATIEGRAVELLSDRTWRYAVEDGCRDLGEGVSFCDAPEEWSRTQPPNADIAASYRIGARHYGQLVVEPVGTEDGLTPELVREAVIENSAASIDGTAEAVETIETKPAEIDGRAAETIVYGLAFDDMEVVYANTVLLLPQRTVQVVTYGIASGYTDAHRALHAEFVAHTKVSN
ncbi:hypothetical protein [Roseovarius salinarum]|uniref:hypothetical protein n=1 Tax=Roseovarius salinarum TaxID=1981892 RepID=UPI000C325545|nr:hypothetical protein [Roseovarius salinarum]